MSATPTTTSTATSVRPVRHAIPTVTLSMHEHRADGSVMPITVSMPPTSVNYRADGSVDSVNIFLPICSYCANRITGVRVVPPPKKPGKLKRFGKWLLGVK